MRSFYKILIKLRLIAAVYACSFLFSTPIFAHDFWVTVPEPAPGMFKADIGYGHDFPRSEVIPADRIHLFAPLKLVTPEKIITLDQKGENYASQKKMSLEPGSYMVLGYCKSSFWSKGPGGWAQKDRLQRPDATIVREAILCAKTIFKVGDEAEEKFVTQPAGQRLEFVPMVNPSKVKVADKFPVTVLYDGKPVKAANVTATFAGFSDHDYKAFQGKTDLKGRIDIIPLVPGYWIAKTEHVLKHPDPTRADEFILAATLTFKIEE